MLQAHGGAGLPLAPADVLAGHAVTKLRKHAEEHDDDEIEALLAEYDRRGAELAQNREIMSLLRHYLIKAASRVGRPDLARQVWASTPVGGIEDVGEQVLAELERLGTERAATDLDARTVGAVPALLAMCTEAEETAAAATEVDGLDRTPAWLTTPEVRNAIAAAVPGGLTAELGRLSARTAQLEVQRDRARALHVPIPGMFPPTCTTCVAWADEDDVTGKPWPCETAGELGASTAAPWTDPWSVVPS